MKRTPHNPLPGGVGFYHLCLKDRVQGTLTDYLLADRTGEDYQNASSDSAMFSKFPELKRADCISVLIDGARMANSAARHRAKADILRFFQTLSESQVLTAKPNLCLVLTKLDFIQEQSEVIQTKAVQDFDQLISSVRARFGGLFSEIADFRVAASPEASHVLPYGHGVEDLFAYWVKSSLNVHHAARPEGSLPNKTRSIEWFGSFEVNGREQ
jgi:hypothetical protein